MTHLSQQHEAVKGDGGVAQATMSATLLLVDDEKNILSSLRRLFRPLGYKILTASSGQEGLDLLCEEKVDLIISDMRMPGMDGATLLSKVAERWPDIVRILLTGYSDLSSTVEAINKGQIYKYISKPWEDNDLILGVKQALEQRFLQQERDRLLVLTRDQNEQLKDLNTNLEDMVKQRTAEIQQTLGMFEASNEALQQSYATMIEVFSNIVAMRRGYSGSELRRKGEIARSISIAMGLDDSQVKDIYYATLLRDIGQVGLPDALFNKPLTALSSADRVTVQKHGVIGQGLLMALEPLQNVGHIIRCQNERYDGRGYPDKLAGSDIPTGARILTVLNDFYGLQNGSIAEKKFTPTEAREFILKEKGKRYDSEVADIFFKVVTFAEAKIKNEGVELVKSNGLRADMVLARDIISESGVLLLSAGYIVTEEMIERVDKFERSTNEDLDIFIVKKRS